jgi:hypothetical protein
MAPAPDLDPLFTSLAIGVFAVPMTYLCDFIAHSPAGCWKGDGLPVRGHPPLPPSSPFSGYLPQWTPASPSTLQSLLLAGSGQIK